jgi:hypothetical protein
MDNLIFGCDQKTVVIIEYRNIIQIIQETPKLQHLPKIYSEYEMCDACSSRTSVYMCDKYLVSYVQDTCRNVCWSSCQVVINFV